LAAVPSVIGGPDCDFIGWRSERGGLARQQLSASIEAIATLLPVVRRPDYR